MARRDECRLLLLAGYNPVEIMAQMSLTRSTVMQYLYHQVGVGAIRRTDILHSIPEDTRSDIEALIKELNTTYTGTLYIQALMKGLKVSRDLLEIYMELRDNRIARGDMYELISDVEATLHQFIKSILFLEYGPDEKGWWRKGIPAQIRAACAEARENDPEPGDEPFNYTTFIHLHDILDKQWRVFSKFIPKPLASNKKGFLGKFARLNTIRNCIMHPVKGLPLTDADFNLVYSFHQDVEQIKQYASSTRPNTMSGELTSAIMV